MRTRRVTWTILLGLALIAASSFGTAVTGASIGDGDDLTDDSTDNVDETVDGTVETVDDTTDGTTDDTIDDTSDDTDDAVDDTTDDPDSTADDTTEAADDAGDDVVERAGSAIRTDPGDHEPVPRIPDGPADGAPAETALLDRLMPDVSDQVPAYGVQTSNSDPFQVEVADLLYADLGPMEPRNCTPSQAPCTVEYVASGVAYQGTHVEADPSVTVPGVTVETHAGVGAVTFQGDADWPDGITIDITDETGHEVAAEVTLAGPDQDGQTKYQVAGEKICGHKTYDTVASYVTRVQVRLYVMDPFNGGCAFNAATTGTVTLGTP